MYDAAVFESVFLDIMLHYFVVAMRIDADVALFSEAELHDTLEDAMHLRKTRYAMDDMVRLAVVEPFAVVNLIVGRFRRWQKGEIRHNLSIVFNHEAAVFLNVRLHNIQRWIAVDPLVHVAVGCHDALGGSEDFHQTLAIFWERDFAYGAVWCGIVRF